jgi:hypothetical protein
MINYATEVVGVFVIIFRAPLHLPPDKEISTISAPSKVRLRLENFKFSFGEAVTRFFLSKVPDTILMRVCLGVLRPRGMDFKYKTNIFCSLLVY